MRILDHFAPYAAARLYNRGTKALGDQQPAQRSLLASLACAPYTAQTWLNLGNALMAEGDVHAALGMFRRAHRLKPDAQSATNIGIALIALGQLREGWAMYEHRFALPEFIQRNGLKGGDATKMWRGDDLTGKTLLVFSEQGAGDTIMMLRFLVIPTDTTIIARVPAPLFRLVRASGSVLGKGITIVGDGERMPPHDYLVPFMSLPHHLTPDPRFFSHGGYLELHASEEPYAFTPPLHGLRVGIVWAGNPNHPGDKRRSIALEQFASCFETRGISWVSLQVGSRAKEIPAYPSVRTVHLSDFYDTAHVMKSLDLVISVDSAPAHLAGALGVPVWTLLPFSADFRWMQDREDTPWYSSMKLWRQRAPGDWAGVIARVQRALEVLAASRRHDI